MSKKPTTTAPINPIPAGAFTLDATTGSIIGALKHLMDDPCPGNIEVAIMDTDTRSELWLLVRWGRFQFVTVPAVRLNPTFAHVKNEDGTPMVDKDSWIDYHWWVEMREGEQTIHSGKRFLCMVTPPVAPERAVLRHHVSCALDLLKAKQDAAMRLQWEAAERAVPQMNAHETNLSAAKA